jgi:sulfite dehydrogenase (cytochrome) subunit B
MRSGLLDAAIALLQCAAAYAGEQPVSLKDAPGDDLVENNCASRHSLDYPRTNASFMDRKTWQAEVDKMTNVFGAPIAPDDAKAIVDYLTKNYGTGS